jgi:hypothetical protein
MRRSFYDGPQLKAGLRQVSDATFFWSTGRPVPIGFQVPKAHPRDAELEGIFEQVRQRLAPQAPSRLDCVFVCPLPERGFCSHSTSWRGDGKFVYKVSVTGNTFTTDGGYWTEAKFRPERAESWAESYWNPRGRITDNRAEETLVEGKVIVVESMWEKPSAERVASRWKAAADVTAWTDTFFRRHPRLKPYMRGLRRVRESTGGSGSHGEARQTGDDILLFPKFWALNPQTQDFVFAHELGHWVLTSRGGTRSLLEKASRDGVDLWDLDNLPFGQFNMEEGFADSFASYFIDGDVQRRYPLWTKWVEEYL